MLNAQPWACRRRSRGRFQSTRCIQSRRSKRCRAKYRRKRKRNRGFVDETCNASCCVRAEGLDSLQQPAHHTAHKRLALCRKPHHTDHAAPRHIRPHHATSRHTLHHATLPPPRLSSAQCFAYLNAAVPVSVRGALPPSCGETVASTHSFVQVSSSMATEYS